MTSKRKLDEDYLVADESNGTRAKPPQNREISNAQSHNGLEEDADDAEDEDGDFKDEDDVFVAEEVEDGANLCQLHYYGQFDKFE